MQYIHDYVKETKKRPRKGGEKGHADWPDFLEGPLLLLYTLHFPSDSDSEDPNGDIVWVIQFANRLFLPSFYAILSAGCSWHRASTPSIFYIPAEYDRTPDTNH